MAVVGHGGVIDEENSMVEPTAKNEIHDVIPGT